MEHLLLKAATTATTDQGVFEAVISTPTVDRDKDIVEPQAMVDALKKWADLGKLVPLAWAHTEDVVGNVDPATVRVENAEVIVKGQIDQTVELGMTAWRLVKSGTLSFSFGYLIPKGGASKRPGGGLNIKELDLFEISVVPVGPANNDTRILSFKSADELRKESDRLEREIAEAQIPELPPAPEVKRLASDVREQLDDAGAERFGRTQDKWVYLDDYDPDAKWAVFCVDPAAGQDRYVQVSYTLDSDGGLSLGDTETEVVRTTSYRAVSDGKTYTTSELQEVKARLATAETALEDRKAPSMDPLRRRSEELALEVASDGMSLRRPPTKAAPPTPDLTDLPELKRQSRDLMDLLLSDTME